LQYFAGILLKLKSWYQVISHYCTAAYVSFQPVI